jgi:hypothetical protein
VCVCTSTVVVSCGPLSPNPSTSSAKDTSENTEEHPMAQNKQLKDMFKWYISLISCTA